MSNGIAQSNNEALSDPRLITVSRLFYHDQLTKTEIADKLRISITHVNRLLKIATQQGIVQISIKVPRFEDLEFALLQRYQLVDARVVATAPSEQDLEAELGRTAAAYFEEKISLDSPARIGLGSGRTLFEMVSALPERPRNLQVYPLSVFAQQELKIRGVDANTVVNILWFKSRPDAAAYRFEMFFPGESIGSLKDLVQALREKREIQGLANTIANLDYYFFSCSNLREVSHLVGLSEASGGGLAALKGKGIIGDIVLNTIDQEGQSVSADIESFLFHIQRDELRNAALNGKKKVVLIAGWPTKYEVIKAGLKARLFNLLITDNQTAERLIRDS